ncbi:MAG: hypothetical protein EOO01_13595 [Chitinophagaceae bacterium]|nr:MAG: hypothetical protein EOO01_13595 [Chitinophagaceae bacterium]
MRILIPLILLSVYSCQLFYQAGVVIWFHANRAYVASVLCENKAKPELKCKGNCQLNKMAKNEDEKGDSTLPSSAQKWVEISPCELVSSEIDFQSFTLFRNYASVNPETYHFRPDYGIFHPPIA